MFQDYLYFLFILKDEIPKKCAHHSLAKIPIDFSYSWNKALNEAHDATNKIIPGQVVFNQFSAQFLLTFLLQLQLSLLNNFKNFNYDHYWNAICSEVAKLIKAKYLDKYLAAINPAHNFSSPTDSPINSPHRNRSGSRRHALNDESTKFGNQIDYSPMSTAFNNLTLILRDLANISRVLSPPPNPNADFEVCNAASIIPGSDESTTASLPESAFHTPPPIRKESAPATAKLPTPTRPDTRNVQKKLFAGEKPIFKINFHEPMQLDLSLLQKFGSYFTINGDALNVSTWMQNKAAMEKSLLAWIKQKTLGWYGGYETHHENDCLAILKILTNHTNNPCILLFAILRAILARSDIYLLDIEPLTNKLRDLPVSGSDYYFIVQPLSGRKIILMSTFAIKKLSADHVNYEYEDYLGKNFALLVKVTMEIDLSTNQVTVGQCELSSVFTVMQAALATIEKFNLQELACEKEDAAAADKQYDFITAMLNQLLHADLQAADLLTPDRLTDLPVSMVLPEYTTELYKQALAEYDNNIEFAQLIDSLVKKDIDRSIKFNGPGMHQLTKCSSLEGWSLAQNYLEKTSHDSTTIKAIRIQLPQGMVNPAYSLWTELMALRLPKFFGIQLHPYKPLHTKPIHFYQQHNGKWVLKIEYLIYGLLFSSPQTVGMHGHDYSFPLFSFVVILNLPTTDSFPTQWIATAYVRKTPLGQRILDKIGCSTVFEQFVTHYQKQSHVTDRESDNELLITVNVLPMPGNKELLLRKISAVKNRITSEEVHNAETILRLMLGDKFLTSDHAINCKCLLENLTENFSNLAVKHALVLDWYEFNCQPFEQNDLMLQLTKIKEGKLQTYIRQRLNANIADLGKCKYIMTALALQQGKQLHLFEEMPVDATHPKIWIKHVYSYLLPPELKSHMVAAQIPSKDIYILCGREKNNGKYWLLEGDIIASETALANCTNSSSQSLNLDSYV